MEQLDLLNTTDVRQRRFETDDSQNQSQVKRRGGILGDATWQYFQLLNQNTKTELKDVVRPDAINAANGMLKKSPDPSVHLLS